MRKNSENDKDRDDGEAIDKYERMVEEKLSGHESMPEADKFVGKHNLKMPPGLCGEVTRYINSQCRYPLEHLAVLSAIVAIGNIGGLNHALDKSKTTSNLFACCVAGSGCGKEAVMQAFTEIHIMAGISGAMHGTIKSEQEITRNLINHQAAYYNIDEWGYFLQKLAAAERSASGAAYLQGIKTLLLSAYSKAFGNLLISGDLKKEIREELNREYAKVNKQLEDDKTDANEQRLKDIQAALDNIDKGLKDPFLSLIGFTTPSTFNESVTPKSIDDGFIGRSLISNEKNTNPRAKREFEYAEMPEDLKYAIHALVAADEADSNYGRVEYKGKKRVIVTTPEAKQLLSDALDWIEEEAEHHVENTGFQAVIKRGYEMIEKVSFILAMGSDTRGAVEVEWAHEYIRADLRYKTLLAYSNQKERTAPLSAMMAKILKDIGEDGMTLREMVNKYHGGAKKELVEDAVEVLIKSNRIYKKLCINKYNKIEYTRIFKL